MVRGVVSIFGVVAHALDLMVPEAIRMKLEPMIISSNKLAKTVVAAVVVCEMVHTW